VVAEIRLEEKGGDFSMIDVIPDMPDNVVALRAKGKVTGEDYERVLIPAVEAAVKEHGKIRLLYHIGNEFSGVEARAMWDDAKVGFKHITAWERIAVISDVDWIRNVMRFFGFVIPGQVRVFRNDQYSEAEEWIKA
jgi:hypothetical protein